ncbi:MAG: SpoIID/LytB domain-containing protein [Phormidesmis sp.]
MAGYSSVLLGLGMIGSAAMGGAVLLEGAIAPLSAQAQSTSVNLARDLAEVRNPEIEVGIVQRFGQERDDTITLAPLAGDQITVAFETGGQAQTLTTNQLQIEIVMQPLEQPVLQEWVVLSTHRSFESAEASALQWQEKGIEAEMAQPDAWQVWAKREDYSTPLLRHLLLKNLQAAGYSDTFIDSRVVSAVPRSAFVANGYRYARDEFTMTTANERFQLAQGQSQGDRTRYNDLFGGEMKIQPNAYGDYTLVNQVPIDLYLRGVVPHEIGPSAPRNAIEAQAILARTYALRNLRRFAIDDYELCADTQCQVYFGLADTDPVSDSAIAATAGQVLTYNNELVDALYSSTTGGITARFTDVWNGEDRPYLRPVVDSIQPRWNLATRPLSDEANFRAFIALSSGFNEDGWSEFRWNREASLKDIGETMKEYLSNRQHPLAGFTQLTGLTVTERAPSGRIQKLQVSTDIGSFDLVKDEVVKALVPPRSLLFYLEPVLEMPPASPSDPNPASGQVSEPAPTSVPKIAVPTKPGAEKASEKQNTLPIPLPQPILTGYRFIGGGFGHGVGMSQTGAYNLGKQGYSSEQILEFYYPGTELQPISESTIFYKAD